MEKNYTFFIVVSIIFTLPYFHSSDQGSSEETNLNMFEQKALLSNQPGKEYIVDLTSIEGCNKSKVKYLGTVTTNGHISYKIITSFFVQRTGKDMCHGVSSIKIFDTAGHYLGRYGIGMPQDLPDTLIGKKLFFTTINEECNLRKAASIDLSHGLPKQIFVACSSSGGDIYSFR